MGEVRDLPLQKGAGGFLHVQASLAQVRWDVSKSPESPFSKGKARIRTPQNTFEKALAAFLTLDDHPCSWHEFFIDDQLKSGEARNISSCLPKLFGE